MRGALRRLVIRLTFLCSDPDWEAVNWAPEGLRFEVNVPPGFIRWTGAGGNAAKPSPTLKLLGPPGLPGRFQEFLPLLFAEYFDLQSQIQATICRSLQYLDRNLVKLWMKIRQASRAAEDFAAAAIIAARPPVCQGPSAPARTVDLPWDLEEQHRLHEAVASFRDEADPQRRWQLVAEHVASRSARDCAARWRERTQSSEKKRDEPPSKAQALPAAGGASVSASAVPVFTWSLEEVLRLGLRLQLLGMILEGISAMVARELRLQVVCSRCKKPVEMACESQSGTDPSEAKLPCPWCRNDLIIRVVPSICHSRNPAVAHVLAIGCHPVDLLPSCFEGQCAQCPEQLRLRRVGPGYRKRDNCPRCSAKLNCVVEGAQLEGGQVSRWRQVAEKEGERMQSQLLVVEARRREQQLGIRVGEPLPDKGACRHYRKSYRWLRFPCCGRAFPCNECHDEETDHPYEWASRMLCGSCSFEQLLTHEACRRCGVAQSRQTTAFWEGGEGCRNQATMARGDPHKYRGLGKTVSHRGYSSKS